MIRNPAVPVEAWRVRETGLDLDTLALLTVRGSFLSAATQSVIAAEVGQLELTYDYLAERVAPGSQRIRASRRTVGLSRRTKAL